MLGGCTVAQAPAPQIAAASRVPSLYREMYGTRPDERFAIPAVDLSKVDPRFWRREVADPTGERAGTVVVDTGSYFLYWTLGEGRAIRYGVGLGREGFGWDGSATIQRKAQWPTWTPPAEMIAREPELEE